MASSSYQELVILAEQHRKELPEAFFVDLDVFQSSLASDQVSIGIRSRSAWFKKRNKGKRTAKGVWSPLIQKAILIELHQLFCTDDAYYIKVREAGQQLSGPAVTAVAVCVAGPLGVPIGLATGAVAFLGLAILKVGTRVYCELTQDLAPPAQQ